MDYAKARMDLIKVPVKVTRKAGEVLQGNNHNASDRHA